LDTDQLKQLSVRLTHLSTLLEDQAQNAARKIAASSDALLQGVGSQAHAVMTQAAESALEPCTNQLVRSAESAKWAADALQEQRRTLSSTQQSLVYLGLASLSIGCLLALTATVYWVKVSREEVARNRVEVALLRAVNQADINLCDGRLCANVEARGKRYGVQKQYQFVKPRLTKPTNTAKEARE
jgi:hypothetical protein